MKKQLLFMLLALSTIMVISCEKDNDPPDDNDDPIACVTTGMTYTDDIASILNTNCAVSGCHNENPTNTFSMANYADAQQATTFGLIVGSINHEDGFKPMPYPPGSEKMDSCSINKITAWIADGAPE